MLLSLSTSWGVVMCCQPACSPCACHCSGWELWVPASCQLANCVWLCGRLCVYVCALPSEHFVDSALPCQWHIEQVRWESPGFPCAVFTPSVYSPKTLSNLLPFSLSLSLYFSLSVDPSYLLRTPLDLSFQISSFMVVRWRASRQPALVSPSAGGRIEFVSSHPASDLFCLKSQNTSFSRFLIIKVGVRLWVKCQMH